MQHLLREVCADSPPPRHRLFLAAVTVHYSHENKLLSLPRPSLGHHTRGQGCRGPWAPALIMHCLWSWVTAKAARGTGTPPPVVLREARSLNQPGLEGREEILRELTLDALLDMNEAKVKETLRRCGANAEECGRLQYALTCLRKVTGLGGEHKEDSGWSSLDARRESSSGTSADTLCPASPWPLGSSQLGRMGSVAQGPRSVSVSALPVSDSPTPGPGEGLSDPCIPLHSGGRLTPRALHSFITPPTTPQLRRHAKLKPPRTPPPPSRKVFQLLPSFPTLTRSKSHESQLGNRIDEVSPMRFSTKSWLSQVCHVCQKSMMFGVKCKHCR
ncbi:Kinase suppressor of Ras 1 [Camelus dromedarius]|uniref:Kinase suppressor of Ras 1 n=1 Tax=Camelus dromedarius TaxID=9838 RepID=A0A5N4D4S3_CAMDR|nr:Kinase suppressor of Ras 1 [Camelus dromedarius]